MHTNTCIKYNCSEYEIVSRHKSTPQHSNSAHKGVCGVRLVFVLPK